MAQLLILAPREDAARDRPLCIVNTHLFYHPRANHLRTIHTAAMMAEAHALIDLAVQQSEQQSVLRRCRPSLIFCGDLNSGFNKGIPGGSMTAGLLVTSDRTLAASEALSLAILVWGATLPLM